MVTQPRACGGGRGPGTPPRVSSRCGCVSGAFPLEQLQEGPRGRARRTWRRSSATRVSGQSTPRRWSSAATERGSTSSGAEGEELLTTTPREAVPPRQQRRRRGVSPDRYRGPDPLPAQGSWRVGVRGPAASCAPLSSPTPVIASRPPAVRGRRSGDVPDELDDPRPDVAGAVHGRVRWPATATARRGGSAAWRRPRGSSRASRPTSGRPPGRTPRRAAPEDHDGGDARVGHLQERAGGGRAPTRPRTGPSTSSRTRTTSTAPVDARTTRGRRRRG